MQDPHIFAAEKKRDEINIRLKTVEAQIQENRRMWVCEREATTLEQRVTLDAQRAQLAADKALAEIELRDAKLAYFNGRRATHFGALVQLLRDQGLGHLVERAAEIAQGAQA